MSLAPSGLRARHAPQADEEKKTEGAGAEEEEDGRTVNLMSQEGDQFQVEVKVAKMSELVKTMIPEEVRTSRAAVGSGSRSG